MIVFTEEELTNLADIILRKIDKDKRFDQYTDGQIVTILGQTIMQVGMNCMMNEQEEETADENWQAS
jgi:hypothetical protein